MFGRPGTAVSHRLNTTPGIFNNPRIRVLLENKVDEFLAAYIVGMNKVNISDSNIGI